MSPDDFPSEAAGRIVLLAKEAGLLYRTQVANAEAAGAIGVILFNSIRFPGNYGGTWRPNIEATDMPVLAATWNQGEWLEEMLRAQGAVSLRLQTKHYENLESVNVIGIKPAESGDLAADAVLVTAHLDSVIGSPGANDDASGVGLALELARVLRDYNTDKELRFVLFGCEEKGTVGSHYYVDQLSNAELNRIVGVFNADMVATSDPEINEFYALTSGGSTNLVTDVAEAAGSRLGDSSVLPGELGFGDHVSFHEVGIAAALFIWMNPDGSSIWNGSLEKFYHTPQDSLADNISPERMQNALNIVGAAVFDLVRKEVPALERSRVRAAPNETNPLE
jgi:aminopeptidase YwaD